MKLKFENQAYQLQAVENTVALFDSMKSLDVATALNNTNEILSFDIVANGLIIENDKLLKNLQAIQLANNLENYSTELFNNEYIGIPNFSLEMETGTGKTYVYIRTIFELHKRYGLTKFIVVVPSDAIRAGTLKSLEITKEHIQAEYNNINYDYYVYDSSKANKVRDFATTNTIQIMIMTIAAFNKDTNNIYEYKDKYGEHRPIDLIKAAKPIVIIDEPQSVDNTDKAKQSIKELNPLFILRYSATHREMYNQLYKLDAVDAYAEKLVKQIEVASIEDAPFANVSTKPYIKVVEITPKLELSLELASFDNKGKTSFKVFKKIIKGTDLQAKTNNEAYNGYIVEDYSRDYGLKLANLDYEIEIGNSIGNEENIQLKTIVMIRLTIENHIKRELRLAKLDIKVLSLFFINKVSDYREYYNDGVITEGWLAKTFKEQLKIVLDTSDGKKYLELCRQKFGLDLDNELELSKIHDGYFARDKKGVYKDSKEDTQDAVAAYQLIMQDKEKLLDPQVPLRFIFSHSALKEGWDNPNVFQVCVLQDSSNTFKRRQQIGRGMRLCVNAQGDRIRDSKINMLTVIASESYNSFAANLQQEYEKDANIKFGHIHKLVFVNKIMQLDTNLSHDKAIKISEMIHNDLIAKHYISAENKITEKGLKALKSGLLELNSIEIKEFEPMVESVLIKLCNKLPIQNQRNRTEVPINKKVFMSLEFKQLWQKIKYKTIYTVKLDTDMLIQSVVDKVNTTLDVREQNIKISRANMNIDESGITSELMHESVIVLNSHKVVDIVTKLMLQTGLTRKTIITILQKIDKDKLELSKLNTQSFIVEVANIINDTKTMLLVDGIKYQKISDLNLADNLQSSEQYYSQSLFEQYQDYGYKEDTMIDTNSNIANASELGVSADNFASKFLFDVLRYDSQVEFNFLKEAISSDKVKLITKLPNWFKVNTPLGTYNPDWALLLDEAGCDNIYFIAETKGENFEHDGRLSEKAKTKCGKLHFIDALGVDYKVVSSLEEILN
jgi:type III restriction enzyme